MKLMKSTQLPSCLVIAFSGLIGCTTPTSGGGNESPAATGGSSGQGGSAGKGSGGSDQSGQGGTAGSGGSGASEPSGTGGASSGSGGSAATGTGGSASTGSGGSPATPDAGGGSDTGPSSPGGPPPEGTGATDLAKHKFSKVIKMDTTAAGAGVSADIPNFPVAVLLDATFDFSQAKPLGQDVRFATMEGTPLPYAIELWDPAGKKAALWVRTDVKGNNNTQAIVMHWGNPDAESAAASKSVFSKEAGFLGVWHLNEDGSTVEGGYKDASWNEVHGTGIKMAAGSTAAARVGLGTKFNNEGGGGANVQWVKVDGPKVAQDFNGNEHAISATIWANATSWKGYYETYFSKGDRSWTLQRDYQGRVEACQYVGYHSCAITAKPTTGDWVHWMLVQKKGSITIFKNGVRVAGAGGNTQYGDHAFGIGNQTQYNMGADWKRGFHGTIDEVRVLGVEKDANWAKLDYESQREGSKFLSFGATMMK